MQQAPGSGDGRRYIGWFLRLTGRLRESLDETERTYRLDALDPMFANLVALARMAPGRIAEPVPVDEDLVARIPVMSIPISSLLRARAFRQDWGAVHRLVTLAAQRPLREFHDAIPFVRAKRGPTPEHIGAWRSMFQDHVAYAGGVDVARLVYAVRLGLVDFWMTTGKWPDCADEVPYDFRAESGRARDVPNEEFGF